MRFKIVFEDYLRRGHVESIKTLLKGLQGVDILEEDDEHMLIGVSDDMVTVIEDMNLCDYITAIRQQ